MDLDPSVLQQLLETFSAELDDHLQEMTQSLLLLEKDLSVSEQQDVLNTIFRSAHTIKGAARGLELENIGDISHHLESLFSGLKEKQVKPEPATIDLCFESLDSLRDLMFAFKEKREPKFDMIDLLTKLDIAADQFTKRDVRPSIEPEQNKEDTSPAAQLSPDSVRISINKLNKISALAEGVHLNKLILEDAYNHFKTLNSQLENLLANTNTDLSAEMEQNISNFTKSFHGIVGDLGFVSNELLATSRLIRLVPAASMLQPLFRSARDISKELNKEVDFKIVGDDIEIDRAILELVRGPLIHLLRNAIDHGIEAKEERKKLGKTNVCMIKLIIEREGNEILLTLEDDGAGLDVDAIRNKGIEKKFITAEEAQSLSEKDIIDLIFRPGFSTKHIITDVSGRGVGMDVVKTNIQSMRGQVRVETEKGKGTKIIMRLPLTLTTERGVIVKTSGQRFAIPTISVRCTLECKRSDIINIVGGNALLVNKEPVPLYALSEVLGINSESVSVDKAPVVVINRAWTSIAFIVDQIIGEQEIVIKPLLPPLEKIQNVAGAALTGRGNIIIVLNPQELVASSLNTKASMQIADSHADEDEAAMRILVVDDSITTRTLEKNMLEAHNYDVSVAVNGKEAWELIQTESYDLVIADIEMPILNGFELTEKIKQSDKFKNLPVIIVSSLSSDADKKKGIEVGADAYIVKSNFESGVLLQVIKQLIVKET